MNSTKKIQKLIEGNKLRLVFKRVCENCSDAVIPRSDFPHHWPVRYTLPAAGSTAVPKSLSPQHDVPVTRFETGYVRSV
jgi:hypothetical protein